MAFLPGARDYRDAAPKAPRRFVVSRRGWRAATAAWWVSILLSVPFGRALVDALRSRGLLVLGVTAGFAALFVALAVVVRRLRQRRALTPSISALALLLTGVVTVLAQLLPRAEERWHVAQYAVLGALLWPALGGALGRRLVLGAALLLAAGWLDEGIQHLLPERVYDLWDVALNAVAGWAGMAVVAFAHAAAGRQREPRGAER